MSSLGRRRAIARRLSRSRLQYADSESLSLAELEGSLQQPIPSDTRYFLAYYSPQGVEHAMRAYGVYDVLEQLGFDKIQLVLDTHDPYEHRLALYHRQVGAEHLLHEMVVRRRSLQFLNGFDLLEVEWMCSQNPYADFGSERPALPGQDHPGLGIGHMVMDLVQISAERLKLAGVLSVPAYFHNAVMYASHFHYLDPLAEARLVALNQQLVLKYGLAKVSWAFEQGEVLENQQVLEWFHCEQILPLAPDLIHYFTSRAYKRQIKKMRHGLSYTLNT